MKLNHNDFMDYITSSVKNYLPLKPEDGAGKVSLNVQTNGRKQTFEFTIYPLSFYSGYRYMWE